jgi:hypothetical protein
MTDAAPRRWGFGVGIAALILGILTGIGAIGWGVYSIGLTLVREARTAQAPLLVGEPGSPMPTEQTACDDPCFGVEHLWESRLTAADFERLGTAVVVDPAGTYADSTATEQHELGIAYWDDAGYSPDSCLFTASEAPVIIERGAARDAGGTIHWLTSFESESRVSGTARALRFFPTAEAAQQHLRTLHELVPGCTAYGATDISAWRASVTPMPALELPPTVAAVGWVESSALQGRYYAVDLLRSNAVLRLVLWTDTEISEQAFRDLAEQAARDMAGWPLVVDPGSRADEPQPGFLPDENGATGPRDDCTGDCFSVAQAQSLAPSPAELAAVGLRRTGSAQPQGDSAGEAQRARQVIETSNAQCRFALGIAPVVRGNPSAGSAAETDPLVNLGQFAGGGTSMSVIARVFENPERASAYAAAAEFALGLCGDQIVDTRGADGAVTTRPATITGYNSIDDPIVAERTTLHVGWQNAGALTDRGHDLQHGNIVVRVVIDGVPLTEAEVATLVLPMIERLEALESNR